MGRQDQEGLSGLVIEHEPTLATGIVSTGRTDKQVRRRLRLYVDDVPVPDRV